MLAVIFTSAKETRSDGCTDEISIKSVINLKRNLATVSARIFRFAHTLHIYAFARSFATIACCIVRSVAKRCAKLSHACFRPGKASRYQRRYRFNCGSQFLLHQRRAARMARTCINYYN